jgi:hypothetical protein
VTLRTTTTLLLVLAAGLAAGCGADEEQSRPIPAAVAAELDKRLTSVEGRFNFGDGACADIAEDQSLANETIRGLPDDVDPDVRQALQDGFDRLFRLTDEQCDETKGQQTQPDTVPQPPPQTETETTPTVPQTETETVPTTPEQPPLEPTTPEETPDGTDGTDGTGGAASPEEQG